MEAHVRAIISKVKKPNRDAVKRAERLIKDMKVLAKGEGSDKPGVYDQIAKDIAMIPAEHIAFAFGAVTRAGSKCFIQTSLLHRHLAVSTFSFLVSWYGYTALGASNTIAGDYHLLAEMYDNFVFGTIKTNSRKEFNSPGSLGKALGKSNAEKRRVGCYKEVKLMRYRKLILRLVKTEATHSDDERPTGEGRNPVVTAFFGGQDRKITRRLERSPTRKREPESRTLASPPTSSALSRVLPIGIPIDFWTPQFYNELDLHEKAMYVNTGVAFPLPQFCTTEHHKDWYRMNTKDFMVKYGNDVLARYNIPTADELAGLPSESADEGGQNSGEEEETDLEDTEDSSDQMED
ncbi:hypothetical protein B0H10DRAFT_2445651 [Mycena sp. CBHHK59/15]|nr:hypothetical protein B0H10DRAFT_2445651 [Mycena sp. CBHHK59/15]